MFLRSDLGLFVKYRAQASNLTPLCPDDVEILCLDGVFAEAQWVAQGDWGVQPFVL